MANKVLLKKSSVVGKIPTSSDLSYGELALNYADGKLYFKDSNNTIQNFSNQLSINNLTDVDTTSTSPIVGDVLKWNGTNWVPGTDSTSGGAGTDADTLDGFDSSYFLNYNNLSNKPTLFSGSYNDLTDKPTIPTVPSVLSAFTNDVGFITDYTETDPIYTASSWYTTNNNSFNWNTAYDWGDHASAGYLTTSSTIDWDQIVNEPVLFSGDYNDLTNKPTIPSLTGYATETYVNTQIANLVDSSPTTLDTLNELAAALGDDPNFATTIATQLGNKANTVDLATVATSGSYNDLIDKPTLFSGSYNDLIDKPTLFSGSYNDLTDKPTNVSSFNNDANYVNSTQLATKQNTLVSGTNIKTINGTSLLGSGNITITGGSGDGLYTNTVTLSDITSNQEVDAFDITQYRTVKYLIQLISGGDVESIEINLMHTDVGILISQYNRMSSGSELGVFSASIDSTNAYLRFSPVNPDTTIDLTRISIIARTLNPLLLLNDLENQTLATIDLETDSYPTTDLN